MDIRVSCDQGFKIFSHFKVLNCLIPLEFICVVLSKIIISLLFLFITSKSFFCQFNYFLPITNFHTHFNNKILSIHILVEFFCLIIIAVMTIYFSSLLIFVFNFLNHLHKLNPWSLSKMKEKFTLQNLYKEKMLSLHIWNSVHLMLFQPDIPIVLYEDP